MRVGAPEHHGVDDTAEAADERPDDHGEELGAVGVDPEHGGAGLVLPDGRHGVARARADQPRHRTPRDDDESQGEPVAVRRVGDTHEQVGNAGPRQGLALLATGQVAGVAQDDDRRRLREGQGHHGEGDPADPQRDRADHQGQERRPREGDDGGQPQRERP